MSVPNYSNIVNSVYASGNYQLNSVEGAGRFTEAVVKALHSVDKNFGHLKKNPGQNQYNGHAVDATLYRENGNTVDFIHGAGDPDAKPGWSVNENDNYPQDKWFAPESGPIDPPTPQPGNGKSYEATMIEFINAAAGAMDSMQGKLDWLMQNNIESPGATLPSSELRAILNEVVNDAIQKVINGYTITVARLPVVFTKK